MASLAEIANGYRVQPEPSLSDLASIYKEAIAQSFRPRTSADLTPKPYRGDLGYDRPPSERLKQWAMDTAERFGVGREGQQRAGSATDTLATLSMLPALADAAWHSKRGEPGGTALASLGAVPGAGGALARLAGKEARAGIRAYHGSPHDFDRFDINKIGTGEGAQAYGHGLYFAEAEPVARQYRDSLIDRASNSRTAQGAAERNFGSGPDEAIANLEGQLRSVRQSLDRHPNSPGAEHMRDMEKMYVGALDLVKGGYRPGGRMYEVNINAKPEQFLDWDKPLAQQPDVLSKLQGAGVFTGTKKFNDWEALVGPGGTYVNPADAAQRAYIAAQQAHGAGAASNTFRDAGIPGIRYLDQGSRGTGTGTSNYVVFNDSLIDILRKYGLAGAAATGAAGGISNQETQ